MNIIESTNDPALFRPWFGPDFETWRAWRVFLAALFGLPITGADLELFRQCTGRTEPPREPATEAWMIVGRRGGKSRIAALLGLFLACFRDYTPYLAPGEVGTLPIISADRKQGRTVMRYLLGLIRAVPMLERMLKNEPTKESIEFTNRTTIEIQSASAATVRNYTLIGAICDELAFWPTDAESANPDVEILNALRPGMGTIPGSVLIALSSPYARRGALYEAHRDHFGRDHDEVLVWQGSTAVLHPHEPGSRLGKLIAKAYADDPPAAAAEYGAEFRRDIESFVSREAVDAVVIPDRRELPPVSDLHYFGFVDPSGGSQDAMTLAIGHRHGDAAILDAVRERRPPFSPAAVVAEFAELLKSYRLSSVTGDRYAGEWPRERFREHGIEYRVSEKVRSDLYRDLLPMLNSGKVELLDHPKLITQLCNLERRTARGGKDSIDHAPGSHDDLVNSAAGALVACARRAEHVAAAPGVIGGPSLWRQGGHAVWTGGMP